MRSARSEAMLIAHAPNVRYLTGFTGSNGVLACSTPEDGPSRFAFFTDGRYTVQAREQVIGPKVTIAKRAASVEAVDWLRQHGNRVVSVEAEHTDLAMLARLKRGAVGVKFRAAEALVERLRMIKDAGELEQMRAAARLANGVFEKILEEIRPGKKESELAAQIEYMCRRLGAEKMSFDTLVSSGNRSALPHGVASESELPERGFVIFDFGVILGGYCSDMTRTVHVGRPDASSIKMYEAVRRAQQAAVEKVRAGVKTSEIDHAARSVIEQQGFGKFFTHSTGHGVGLEIHEQPGLRQEPRPKRGAARARRAASEVARLEAGMVVTIEPGVYVPDVGGVRIEDMVVVTEEGCGVMTTVTKELIVL